MADDVLQIFAEGRVDVRSLSEFIWKPADFIVQRRLAPPINTLNFYIELFNKVASAGVRDINQAIINSGFIITDSFELGATLTQRNQALRHASTGKLYRWGGSLPKVVATSSTPTSSGGTGANAWVEVSDAALRQQLNTINGAELIGIDIDKSYAAGTVANRLSRKFVSGGSFLSTLTSVNDSGKYRVANLVDTAGFNGTVDVSLYLSGGDLYGSAEITSYSNAPARKAVATCTAGVWSGWQEVAMKVDLPEEDALTADYNLDGITPIKKDKKFAVCKGGYSWWNEPQSCQVGGVFRKTVIGAVDAVSGWTKSIVIDTSTNTVPITTANLKNETDYVPDEHNGPVTIEADGTIITFYPGHDDVAYLPYRVAPNNDPTALGKEQRITGSFTRVSYAQAYYIQTASARKVFVFFRTDGINGNGRSWSLATSTNWYEDEPVWEVNELFTDTYLMYLRVVPSADIGLIRFLLTRNATYGNGANGIWFAYLNIVTGGISTAGSVSVGTLGGDAVPMASLAKIYNAPDRIRLYDAQSHSNKIPILLQKFTTQDDGDYRYVEFAIGGSWEITKDVPIVHSGKGLDNSSYYGGAHFSNIFPYKASSNPAIDAVYIARNDSNGQWLLEEYSSSDSGSSWALKRVIDSSATEKIWRPRVPFDTSVNPIEGQVVLTWCKGRWTTYRDYDSAIWALRS